jgi:hypothetical protein
MGKQRLAADPPAFAAHHGVRDDGLVAFTVTCFAVICCWPAAVTVESLGEGSRPAASV